ncbi:MAG: hypothetical protein LBK73_03535 [Treponema sp.]|jgi:hypothetical protein|nr:hypothetical protein [Treponema sp.]
MEDYFTEKQIENIRYFDENLDKLLADPLMKMKHVIIHDRRIAGVFDTFEAAVSRASQTLPDGEYIIQEIVSDREIVSFLYPAMATA